MKIPFLNIEINSLKKVELKEVQEVFEKPIEYQNKIENYNNVSSGFFQTDRPMYGQTYPVVTRSFDGEKTLGELGVIQHTIPDYRGLRLRAYDADMRTDLIKIIVDRFYRWVIGQGLKLQSEVVEEILQLNNVNIDTEQFKERLEVLFNTYSSSKISDPKNQQNLHKTAIEVFKTSFIGGDCLVVVRIKSGYPRVQVIDGIHIENPVGGEFFSNAEKAGNVIKHGIEIDKDGKHIAFYVKKPDYTYERILAYGEKSKRKMAWIVYGDKKRVDHVRGVSCLATIIEKTVKLDRYTEATVTKAEQVANLVYSIQHDNSSTGENPFTSDRLKSNPVIANIGDSYTLANGVAKTINETTSGQAINMPVGSELKIHSNESEINYDSFSKSIFEKLCATVGIPPEVALQSYNSNYSASRAAINNWGFNVDIERNDMVNDFYKNILSIFLEIEVLKGNVNAQPFVNALKEDNEILIEAFINCRFIGKKMPHIDPLKEVKAIREMLGDSTPLISLEQACEELGLGDWDTNYQKFKKEKKNVEPLNNDSNAVPDNNAVGSSGVQS